MCALSARLFYTKKAYCMFAVGPLIAAFSDGYLHSKEDSHVKIPHMRPPICPNTGADGKPDKNDNKTRPAGMR